MALCLSDHLASLSEWKNSEIRRGLFSALKSERSEFKHLNEAKTRFWKGLIIYAANQNWLQHDSILSFDASRLPSLFSSTEGASPLCLPDVIDIMHRTGDIVAMETYLTSNRRSLSDKAADLFKAALRMPVLATSSVYSYIMDSDAEEQRRYRPGAVGDNLAGVYVVTEIVDNICKGVRRIFHERHHDFIDHCISPLDLQRYICEVCKSLGYSQPSPSDFPLITRRLAGSVRPSIVLEEDAEFTNPLLFTGHEALRIDKKNLLVTVRSVIHLKSSLASTVRQASTLGNKVSELDSLLRQYLLVHKNRAMAAEVLKRKKYMQEQLVRLQGSLLNLEQILDSLRMAKTQQEILGAYRSGTSLLKRILASGEIKHADQTMDELLEVLDETKAVDATIAVANQFLEDRALPGVSEADIEAELEALTASSVPNPEGPEGVASDTSPLEEMLQKLSEMRVASHSPSRPTEEPVSEGAGHASLAQ